MAVLLGRMARPVTALALLWRLERADGVVLGFTSHDRALRRDGLVHEPARGGMPSAAMLGGWDGLSIAGALVADGVRAKDLDIGRWDGARIGLYACDWEDESAGTWRLGEGSVSAVLREGAGGGRFLLELSGDMTRLDRLAPPRTSPLCRAVLGDRRCGVAMDEHCTEHVATGAMDGDLVLTMAPPQPTRYAGGRLRVMTGQWAGVDRLVSCIEGARVVLDDKLWADDLAGARVLLEEGCDRRFQTCRERFGNQLAFDGEPMVPGTDTLLRYGDG